MFNLELSVSLNPVVDKKTAEKVTSFMVRQGLTSDNTAVLDDIFTTRLYSTNQWKSGKCSNANFLQMTGITLDIDQGKTIAEVQDLFKEFNYVIHTSSSHREVVPSKGGAQDRFRLILPFDPAQYAFINSPDLARAAYDVIFKKYPFFDQACGDPGRKYFPYLNKKFNLYTLYINDVGNYYSLDMSEINTLVTTQGFSNPASNITRTAVLNLKDYVILPDRKTRVQILDIRSHTSCYCLFCDDWNSSSASAFVNLNGEGLPYMHCSHCHKTYMVDLMKSYPELFIIGKKYLQVREDANDINVDEMPHAYLHNLPIDVRKKLEYGLAQKRSFAASSFKIRRIIDPYIDKNSWEIVAAKSELVVTYAPIPVNVQDNDFINDWLKSTFRQYTDFIKLYMAIALHQNYQPLPLLAFKGARGIGKTTFGELLQAVYPTLSAEWKGIPQTFTEELEKKFLLIEEAEGDKRDMYVQIKAITGAEDVTVHKKYLNKFKVKNNISAILITNNYSPLFLVENEKPQGEHDNPFFMYEFPPIQKLNANIKNMLRERIGHYLRTELRTLYEAWVNDPNHFSFRYGLPTPITPLLRQQFKDSKSGIDLTVDEIYSACLTGIQVRDNKQQLIRTIGPFDIVNATDLKDLMHQLRAPDRNIRVIREKMQAAGYLSATEEPLKKDRQDAWLVLVKPTTSEESNGTNPAIDGSANSTRTS